MTKKQVEGVLKALVKCADTIDKGQLKQIYRILIANGKYPVCPACRQPITNIDDFTWDHILPHCMGGSNDLYNLQPMHSVCNMAKGCTFDSCYLDEQYELTDELVLDVTQRKQKRKKFNKKSPNHVERLKAWHHMQGKKTK